jgi:hypothetical protein
MLKKCNFQGFDGVKVPLAQLRFFFYQYIAARNNPTALIMLSDFRGVFFQGNPFTYRMFEWAPPVAQIGVFQEQYPNKVIYR